MKECGIRLMAELRHDANNILLAMLVSQEAITSTNEGFYEQLCWYFAKTFIIEHNGENERTRRCKIVSIYW